MRNFSRQFTALKAWVRLFLCWWGWSTGVVMGGFVLVWPWPVHLCAERLSAYHHTQDVPVEAKHSHAITCTRDQLGCSRRNGGGGGILLSALRRLSTSLNATSSSSGGKAGGAKAAATGAGDVCPCMVAAAEEASCQFQGFSFVCEELAPQAAGDVSI